MADLLAIFGDASDEKSVARASQFREVVKDPIIYAFARIYARRERDKLDILVMRGRGISPARALLTVGGFIRLRWLIRGRKPRTVWARDVDLALLSLIFFRRARFVYELLDLHPALLRSGLISKLLRWLHAFVISRSDYVVTSSTCFFDEKKTNLVYSAKVIYLENKLWAPSEMEEALLADRLRSKKFVKRPSARIRIVYAGRFRCSKSLATLAQLLEREAVFLKLAGLPEDFVKSDFERLVNLDGVEYIGGFEYPDDLARVYQDVDLSWCMIDDKDGGTNSKLLIPNRLYESCFFGVPVVALVGTCLGDFTMSNRLGWTLPEWDINLLEGFFVNLSSSEVDRMRTCIFERPVEDFFYGAKERKLLEIAMGG